MNNSLLSSMLSMAMPALKKGLSNPDNIKKLIGYLEKQKENFRLHAGEDDICILVETRFGRIFVKIVSVRERSTGETEIVRTFATYTERNIPELLEKIKI